VGAEIFGEENVGSLPGWDPNPPGRELGTHVGVWLLLLRFADSCIAIGQLQGKSSIIQTRPGRCMQGLSGTARKQTNSAGLEDPRSCILMNQGLLCRPLHRSLFHTPNKNRGLRSAATPHPQGPGIEAHFAAALGACLLLHLTSAMSVAASSPSHRYHLMGPKGAGMVGGGTTGGGSSSRAALASSSHETRLLRSVGHTYTAVMCVCV
jgi:hypothetical protein